MTTPTKTPTLDIVKLKVTIADKLWAAKNVNGTLIISDDHSQHRTNFAIVCNIQGASGKKLSEVISEDDVGDILKDIYARRTQFNLSRAVGKLDF